MMNAAPKLLIFCLLLLASCGGRSGRETVTADGAVFEISPEILSSHRADTLIDIGRVREGGIMEFDARLLNGGAEPLVIKGVDTSCGCTKVRYEKRPIAPAGHGAFSFRFDSRGFGGVQLKMIEIHTSASARPYRVLVQAEVETP
jgi:hypothetical protein